jgi:hypothetical protein
MGPAFGLRDHLFKQGFPCPVSSNVADFAMDVIAGYVAPVYSKTIPPVNEIIKTLCDFYEKHFYEDFKKDLQHQLLNIKQSTTSRVLRMEGSPEKSKVGTADEKNAVNMEKLLKLVKKVDHIIINLKNH